MTYLKSECLVKAESAEDLTTWPFIVINHYKGDYKMYIRRKFES